MRLTKFGVRGLVFYVAMIGSFYAAPYVNLFFLLLSFLTLQWATSLVATWRNVQGVTVEFGEFAPVPAQANAVVCAKVRAPRRPRFQIVVELLLEGGRLVRGQTDYIEGNGELPLAIPPLPRGCYAVERATVGSTYPFELLRRRRFIAAPKELVVYPAPSKVQAARSAAQALRESLGLQSAGPGNAQPAGLRDHREGDEQRSINWRASARRSSLIVQEWDGNEGQGLELLLDRRCAGPALEEALSTISAIVELARSNKELLVIYSQGLQATFGDGHEPWSAALRFLATTESLPADGPAPPTVSASVARLPHAMSRRACA